MDLGRDRGCFGVFDKYGEFWPDRFSSSRLCVMLDCLCSFMILIFFGFGCVMCSELKKKEQQKVELKLCVSFGFYSKTVVKLTALLD